MKNFEKFFVKKKSTRVSGADLWKILKKNIVEKMLTNVSSADMRKIVKKICR